MPRNFRFKNSVYLPYISVLQESQWRKTSVISAYIGKYGKFSAEEILGPICWNWVKKGDVRQKVGRD